MGKAQSKLSIEILHELQKSTYFDKKEILQWYQGFVKEAPQGYFTKHDFNRMFSQFFPFGEPLAFSQIMFNMYDTNRNGVLEFREFMQALSIATRGKFEEKLAWSFQLYDIDRDGKISHDEMVIVMDAIYKLVGSTVPLPEEEDSPMKRVDKLFRVMDKNNDRFLDYEEYSNGAKSDPVIIQSLFLYDGYV